MKEENNIKFYNTTELDLLSTDYFKDNKSNFYKHIKDEEIDNIYIGGKPLIVNTINQSKFMPLIFELDNTLIEIGENKHDINKLLLRNISSHTGRFLMNNKILKNNNYIYIDTTIPKNELYFTFTSKRHEESRYENALNEVFYNYGKLKFNHESGFEFKYEYDQFLSLVKITYTFDTDWYLNNDLVVTFDNNDSPYA